MKINVTATCDRTRIGAALGARSAGTPARSGAVAYGALGVVDGNAVAPRVALNPDLAPRGFVV